ncbi:MAG: sodium:proton antiporter NhaD [Bacteroidales bacterium]|jgi:Na+/H+ antiporter NhaD/arsenite permease-like protein|nr:sodium:proton antiporter NhaD [Bacteroidales bacterium]
MFYLIIILFILGYAAIALEHNLSVDKASIALLTGSMVWVCIAFGGDTIYPALPSFQEYLQTHPGASVMEFVTRHELIEHLGEISEVLFFLLGAMTIVEIIDSHGGFSMLSKVIKTTNKVKLLWIFSFLTFFISAALDNLTTTIVMITLMWKLVGGKNTRWFFASMIVIAANAGGAWSPIGDVTTIMLWIGGQVSALSIILQLIVPSLICMLVPLVIISLTMKGETVPPSRTDRTKSLVPTTDRERWIVLIAGSGGLLFVPVFKSVTHLPPYMGVLLALSIMWIMTEILHRKKQKELKMRLTLAGILKKIDTPTIFFFLGILLAVAGLESAGHLNLVGVFLDEKVHNVYAINLAIGALSSVVDNVPLVAGTMGMYDTVSTSVLETISDPAKATYMKHFVADGAFWELLAYCAGTGGSILIIGSAAGVAAMGLAKIDFMWYVKKISLLALAGYLSGAAAYYLIVK